MSRTIALAAGGTGGHMFPAEAIASEMKARGWRTLLLTDARGLRYAKDFPADEVVELAAANPTVRGAMAKAQMALTMAGGVMTARRALAAAAPDIVVGFGGYPSAPGLLAARTLGLPTGVHEQNAVLGRVNRKGAPSARFVAHTFERLDRLPATKGEVVALGNPVRAAVRDAAGTPFAAPEGGPLNVLVFGGSQGASLFGRVFPPAFATLPESLRKRLRVTHQVSDDDRPSVAAAYEQAGVVAELAPFFGDLPARIAASHYVISRSGASSVAEISVIGRPALFVPLGIAMDDHQRANAEVLSAAGAADVLLEAEATPEAAAALISSRLDDEDWLASAAAAARGRVPDDAAARLADLIERLLG